MFNQVFMTGNTKASHNVKSIYVIHIIATPRRSDNIAIDTQLCFYRWHFANCQAMTEPVGLLRGINKAVYVAASTYVCT